MAEGIDTLQSLYSRSGERVFFPTALLRTQRVCLVTLLDETQDLKKTAEHEDPSCPTPVDSHASGQGISSGRHSHCGGSKCAPLGSVNHRLSPPKDVMAVGTPDPAQVSDQLDVQELNRVTIPLKNT
uniref:Uncharacterized protein n=1 Tax=Peronospora matthiolae TaxID=2874970 RepID=A0AAV1T4C4_9STRA